MDWSLVFQEWQLLPSVILKILTNPSLLLTLALGGLIGMVAGMLPGISAIMAMSLLIGFVFRVPADVGLGLLIAIYVGAMAAGGVTAIMVNIPGTPRRRPRSWTAFPWPSRAGAAKPSKPLSAALLSARYWRTPDPYVPALHRDDRHQTGRLGNIPSGHGGHCAGRGPFGRQPAQGLDIRPDRPGHRHGRPWRISGPIPASATPRS